MDDVAALVNSSLDIKNSRLVSDCEFREIFGLAALATLTTII